MGYGIARSFQKHAGILLRQTGCLYSTAFGQLLHAVARQALPLTTVAMGNRFVRCCGCRKLSDYGRRLSDPQWSQAQTLWDYLRLNHSLKKSDLILVFGNPDPRTAKHAAALWIKGYADWVMFSGALGNYTREKWTRPEAEIFSEIAVQNGVPFDRIITETKATNTGENVHFSYDLLSSRNQIPSSVILVQMPLMERRVYATFLKQWPGCSYPSEDERRMDASRVLVSSPPVPLRKYPSDEVGSMVDVVGMMVETMKRIMEYPAMGFQMEQEIPANVKSAYEQLKNNPKFAKKTEKI